MCLFFFKLSEIEVLSLNDRILNSYTCKIIKILLQDLSYKDKHWHEACFLCNKCRVSLVDKQFGSKSEKIYCGGCYDAQFASRCDGCGEIFRAGKLHINFFFYLRKVKNWTSQLILNERSHVLIVFIAIIKTNKYESNLLHMMTMMTMKVCIWPKNATSI